MTDRELMGQALEALVAAFPIVQHEYFVQGASYGKNFVQTKKDCADLAYVKTKETIFALRERLAEPEQSGSCIACGNRMTGLPESFVVATAEVGVTAPEGCSPQQVEALPPHKGGDKTAPPLPEPAVAETATVQQQLEQTPPSDYRRGYWDGFRIGKREGRIEAEDALAQQEHQPTVKQSLTVEQPEQEPVQDEMTEARRIASEYALPDSDIDAGNLYWALHVCLRHIDTAPPPRQWQGLTDEEIAEAANSVRWSNQYHADFARAIEARLKEKNT